MLVKGIQFPEHVLAGREIDVMRNRMRMALRAEKEERKDRNSIRRERFHTFSSSWIKVAASVTIIIAVTAGLYFLGNPNPATPASQPPSAIAEMEKRSNAAGEKSVLFLDDGSKVWLNSASTITFASDFTSGETRDVHLEGEAFFDVTHDANKPFIVHTSGIKVKVLGTSFNVRSYDEEKTIQTTLVTGKVQIEQPADHGQAVGVLQLKPSQRAEFDKLSKIINVHEVVQVNAGAWREDKLVFDETPIDEVLLQLERWYGVRIHVADRANLHCRLSATIAEESLKDVLKLMEVSHRISYTVSGKDVFIEGAFCEEQQNPSELRR